VAELHAWVDESESNKLLDPNTYILAAALCPTDAVDEIRTHLLAIRTPGTPKLHWRDETKPARRLTIVSAVRNCATLEQIVVVRSGTASETQRRPRQAALKQLLVELDQRDVRRAVFESRGPADDERDMTVVRNLRDRHRTISPALKVCHVPGPRDAALWVADAVCGVVTSSRTGQEHYLKMLGDRITIVSVDHTGNVMR
jgi:hypothetical protein